MWQDWVIAIIQWVFVVALIPTIRHPSNKPTFISSLFTGLLLAVMAGVFATLQLWNGTLSATALAGAWLTLAYQRWRIDATI
jgi:hypothetical protein